MHPVFSLIRSPLVEYFNFGLKQKQYVLGLRFAAMRLLVSATGCTIPRKVRNSTRIRDTLVSDGYCELPSVPEDEVAALVAFFLRRVGIQEGNTYKTTEEYFDHHRFLGALRPPGILGSGSSDCLICRFVRRASIVEIVENYLDLPRSRIIASGLIDALVVLKGERRIINNYDDAVVFHRDIDSWRFVKVFVYLNEIEEGDGQHEIFLSSHQKRPVFLSPMLRYTADDIRSRMPHAILRKVTGPRGFSFIENTTAFHRGTIPTRKDRLMLTITYMDESLAKFYPTFFRL